MSFATSELIGESTGGDSSSTSFRLPPLARFWILPCGPCGDLGGGKVGVSDPKRVEASPLILPSRTAPGFGPEVGGWQGPEAQSMPDEEALSSSANLRGSDGEEQACAFLAICSLQYLQLS